VMIMLNGDNDGEGSCENYLILKSFRMEEDCNKFHINENTNVL
jgi:hypothetical protein